MQHVARRYPLIWGFSTGVIMTVVGIGLIGNWVLSTVVGATFGATNWFVWRRSGPGHRWRSRLLQRFPQKDG